MFKKTTQRQFWQDATQSLTDKDIQTKYRRRILLDYLFELDTYLKVNLTDEDINSNNSTNIESEISDRLLAMREAIMDGTRFGYARKDPRRIAMKHSVERDSLSTHPEIKNLQYTADSAYEDDTGSLDSLITEKGNEIIDMSSYYTPEARGEYNKNIETIKSEGRRKFLEYSRAVEFAINQVVHKHTFSKEMARSGYSNETYKMNDKVREAYKESYAPLFLEAWNLSDSVEVGRLVIEARDTDPLRYDGYHFLVENLEDFIINLSNRFNLIEAHNDVKLSVLHNIQRVIGKFVADYKEIYKTYELLRTEFKDFEEKEKELRNKLGSRFSINELFTLLKKKQLKIEGFDSYIPYFFANDTNLSRGSRLKLDILDELIKFTPNTKRDEIELINKARLDIMAIFMSQFRNFDDYVNGIQSQLFEKLGTPALEILQQVESELKSQGKNSPFKTLTKEELKWQPIYSWPTAKENMNPALTTRIDQATNDIRQKLIEKTNEINELYDSIAKYSTKNVPLVVIERDSKGNVVYDKNGNEKMITILQPGSELIQEELNKLFDKKAVLEAELEKMMEEEKNIDEEHIGEIYDLTQKMKPIQEKIEKDPLSRPTNMVALAALEDRIKDTKDAKQKNISDFESKREPIEDAIERLNIAIGIFEGRLLDIEYHPVRRQIDIGRARLDAIDSYISAVRTYAIDNYSSLINNYTFEAVKSIDRLLPKMNALARFINLEYGEVIKSMEMSADEIRGEVLGYDELDPRRINYLYENLQRPQKRDLLRGLRIKRLYEDRFIFTLKLNLRRMNVSENAFNFIKDQIKAGQPVRSIVEGVKQMVSRNELEQSDLFQYQELGDEVNWLANVIIDSENYISRIDLFLDVWATWGDPDIRDMINKGTDDEVVAFRKYLETIESGDFDPAQYIPAEFSEMIDEIYEYNDTVDASENRKMLKDQKKGMYKTYMSEDAFIYNSLVVFRAYKHMEMYDGLLASYFLKKFDMSESMKKRSREKGGFTEKFELEGVADGLVYSHKKTVRDFLGVGLHTCLRMYLDELVFSFNLPAQKEFINHYWDLCYNFFNYTGGDSVTSNTVLKFMHDMYTTFRSPQSPLATPDEQAKLELQVEMSEVADALNVDNIENIIDEINDNASNQANRQEEPIDDNEEQINRVADLLHAESSGSTGNAESVTFEAINASSALNQTSKTTTNSANSANKKINTSNQGSSTRANSTLTPTLTKANMAQRTFNEARSLKNGNLSDFSTDDLNSFKSSIEIALKSVKSGLGKAKQRDLYTQRIEALNERLNTINIELSTRKS